MKRILSIILFLTTLSAAAEDRKPVLVDAQRIWDQGNHNAFTDLIRYRDRWWCCFREGIEHAGCDGKVRVLQSDDGHKWKSAALIGEEGVDLRDPKLSIKPDGQLMIVAGGSVWREDSETPLLKTKQPRVMFSSDGISWTAPRKVLEEGQWLWRVDWHEGRAYGISYPYKRAQHPDPAVAEAAETNGPVPPGPYDWKIKLVTSTDGVNWDLVTHLDVPGRPNEATVRIREDGEMIAMIRRERGNKHGWIGVSQPPYRVWSWHETGYRFGGPNFIVLPDGSLIAGSRSYLHPVPTVIVRMDRDRYKPVLKLPSGGSDTGYPGLVWHEDMLWVSYYSSHEGKTAIYLARVRFQ